MPPKYKLSKSFENFYHVLVEFGDLKLPIEKFTEFIRQTQILELAENKEIQELVLRCFEHEKELTKKKKKVVTTQKKSILKKKCDTKEDGEIASKKKVVIGVPAKKEATKKKKPTTARTKTARKSSE